MIEILAVAGYRSLCDVVMPLNRLNIITGANGSGKSSLYRSLRLLFDLANGNLIQSLASEGGLPSTLWAGPEKPARESEPGEGIVQGTRRKGPVSLRLGFSCAEYCYTIDLGLPQPGRTAFALDPIIKRECVWRGPMMRPGTLWVDRRGTMLKCRDADGQWQEIASNVATHSSVLTEFSDPIRTLDLMVLREIIRTWRFYDHFRVDANAPARQLQVGTYTPILANDGSNLAAALQTILEIGDDVGLRSAISDAFPGSDLIIDSASSRFQVLLHQHGLLRPLSASEFSDGTLRYLLLLAALYSPRPPELLVLNEPESSLHPELIAPLARAIQERSQHAQIVVVTHSRQLIDELSITDSSNAIEIKKVMGATTIVGQGILDRPRWNWPAR